MTSEERSESADIERGLDLDVVAVTAKRGTDPGILEQMTRRARKRNRGLRSDRGRRYEFGVGFSPTESPAKARQRWCGGRSVHVALPARAGRESPWAVNYRLTCSGRHLFGLCARVGSGDFGGIGRRPSLCVRLRTRNRFHAFGRHGKGHRSDRNSSSHKPPQRASPERCAP